MQTDLHDHFKNIFDERQRGKNASISFLLKKIKDNPETLGKKLKDGEKEATDKEISLEELKETLEDANSGKTPVTDAVDKECLTRYWSILDQTIQYAQTFIE